jgi:hypothetical protein
MIYPIQPVLNIDGVDRFEANPIIDWICTEKSSMNEIAIYAAENNIDDKYMRQVAQLVGYSVSGYGTLSYVDDESYAEVCQIAQLKAERDALAAQVESIRQAWNLCQKWPDTIEEIQRISNAIDASPQQSLLEVKADAGRSGYAECALDFGLCSTDEQRAAVVTQAERYAVSIRQGAMRETPAAQSFIIGQTQVECGASEFIDCYAGPIKQGEVE